MFLITYVLQFPNSDIFVIHSVASLSLIYNIVLYEVKRKFCNVNIVFGKDQLKTSLIMSFVYDFSSLWLISCLI